LLKEKGEVRMEKEIEKLLKNLENRLEKIENVLFSDKLEKIKAKSKDYKGLAGGIRFLIDNNFFSQPKCLKEIKNELEKEDYYYSKSGIASTLSETFTKSQKILTRIKTKEGWKYVLRK